MPWSKTVRVQVFSKLPVAGQVKTRLAPDVSPALAARLQAALLRYTCSVAMAVDPHAQLWLTEPPDEDLDIGCQMRIQRGTDLGQRMAHAAADALQEEGVASLIIGSDCPMLDRSYLQSACEALCSRDLIFGPTEDGGYALLGMARPVACDIFAGVPWGTARVLAITRARLQAENIDFCLLGSLYDIDRVGDLRRFLTQNKARDILGESLYQQCHRCCF